MKTRTWMWMSGLLIALFALAVSGSAALAARPADPPGPGTGYGPGIGMTPGAGPQAGRVGGAATTSLVAVAAEKLGMTRADLAAVLQTGKTIGQVADEHQVARTAIVDAFLAPRATQLAQRVANGQITQAQADQMLTTMRTQVTAQLDQSWTPRGPGAGTGYVDQDGDGVCDHAGQGTPGQGQGGRRNR